MPIYPENFVANSLSGTILVTNGFANVILPTNPFALEGDKSFVIRLRKGGINGLVIATSPTITVRDPSQFVSLTANVSTVAEGNLVSFTLVTANAADGSNVFYSIFPVTANVTTADFVGANVGKATIINNQATFTIFANADVSLTNETGETFRVQLRENSPTGNIIFNTSNVVITDVSKRVNVFGFVESARSIAEGSSVTFTISAHNIATGTLLYYYTSGNADIAGANTGSVVMNSVSNTITITTALTVPANQSRTLNLVLSESNLGSPIATSNAITVVDSAGAYLNATGGTITTIDGFRIHTFTSSNNFVVSNFSTAAINEANVLVVAGGGGGGGYPGNSKGGQGGGGGGFVQRTSISFNAADTYAIIVGSGGAGNQLSDTAAPNGANSSITSSGNFANIIAVGGGGGGYVDAPGRPGGSGGGGLIGGSGFGFPGPNQQGFPGASRQFFVYGGGGGASQAGRGETGPLGRGTGGHGAPSLITGSNVIYAGGGGGGSGEQIWDGGEGGGGASGWWVTASPTRSPSALNGNVNSGGGGGGSGIPGGTMTTTGNGGSGVVIIRYPWRPSAFYSSVTANSSALYEGANVFFVVNTLNANAITLFYDTVGNVTSASFVGGNTGSFTVTSNSTVLRLQTVANIPTDETRSFALRIREDSVTGNIALISPNVTVYDANISIYINATGGNVFTSGGYRTHIFTSSNNFAVTDAGKIGGTVEYMIIAGGGGSGFPVGSPSVSMAGGGGAGGALYSTSTVVANTYVVTVGAGGAAGPASRFERGSPGGNSFITGATAIGGIAVGGGNGSFDPSNGGLVGNGGSGGGGVMTPNGASQPGGTGYGYPGILGITQQGYPGADSAWGGGQPAGGGGGAGGFGAGGLPSYSGTQAAGGIGIASPLSSTIPGFFGTPGPGPGRWFAGGGAGTGYPGVGGAGGGGHSNYGGATYVGNVNTGGGAAGMQTSGPGINGYTGGSGIVIIRYPFA